MKPPPQLAPFVDEDALVLALARRTGIDPASPFTDVLVARFDGGPPDQDPQADDALERVERAVDAIRAGGVVLVVDETDRENEGDLVMAAEHVTPERVAFFLRHTSGVLCVALPPERCDELALPLMVSRSTELMGTAFTVSVDAAHSTTTGISAADRSRTVSTLIDPASTPEDLTRPGHVFPLRARTGGVLARQGHTEATVDLARLAGCYPAGLLCEVVSEDKGGMARRPELHRLAARLDLPMVSVLEIARYRRVRERLVRPVSQGRLPTRHGTFTARVYESTVDGAQHVALLVGDPTEKVADPVLARLHSECLTGDVLGSLRCDCGAQLNDALARMGAEGRGVLVYLRGHEGRGIGIGQKIAAYALQDAGLDTVEANVRLGLPVDAREFDLGAQILADVLAGTSSVRLLTNNPAKARAVADQGLVVERVPMPSVPTEHNARYLATKRTRMGHLLPE